MMIIYIFFKKTSSFLLFSYIRIHSSAGSCSSVDVLNSRGVVGIDCESALLKAVRHYPLVTLLSQHSIFSLRGIILAWFCFWIE